MFKLLLIILASFLLGGCNIKSFFVTPPAGLQITTVPASTVYLGDDSQGETPYTNQSLKPGSYVVKLIPSTPALPPYETKLNLSSGTSTILVRNLAENEVDASGYTLQLVEGTSDQAHLSVISDPDMVNVTLDGSPTGFTPLSKLLVSPGSHTLTISSPGYSGQELSVVAQKDYNLIINVKLAASTITLTPPPTSTPSSTPSASPVSEMSKPYVLINETETGWLRIRQEPSGTATELGKANTGEKLKYLGTTNELGWHEVEFEDNPGYVSAKYTTLVK